jgi:hypothetical protein
VLDRQPTEKFSPQQVPYWLPPTGQPGLDEDMKNKSAKVHAS